MVETGYENLLLVRLLLEIRIPSLRKSSVSAQVIHCSSCILAIIILMICTILLSPIDKVAEGLTIEGILENWPKLKAVIMEEWDEKNREVLIDLFGKIRDEWIENDLATWIGANR